MPDQDSCFVCRKHNGLEFVPGGAIYEDGLIFSGHSWSAEDQKTPYLGGFIVEPKRHIPTWMFMFLFWVIMFLIYMSGLSLAIQVHPESIGGLKCLNGLIAQQVIKKKSKSYARRCGHF